MKPFSPKSCLSAGRERSGLYWSTDEDGNHGKFFVRCPATNRPLCILASDGRDWAETGMPFPVWEHVSVSLVDHPDKCPTWPEMCYAKSLFWGPEEVVIQFHPRESEYVNFHAGCLHLWRPIGVDIPCPPGEAVGPTP